MKSYTLRVLGKRKSPLPQRPIPKTNSKSKTKTADTNIAAGTYNGGTSDKLAEATGGEVLKSDVENVGTAFRSTLERIRNRYTLGYYVATDSEHQPSSYHKLRVRLTKQHGSANTDYDVSARRGYFTARP